MISAGIKYLKKNLSRLIAQVNSGEEILITKRGKPVARIIREIEGDKSIYEALEELVRKGLVVLPTKSIGKEHLLPLDVPGKPASEMVIEDRR